jgi:hypothetical protein
MLNRLMCTHLSFVVACCGSLATCLLYFVCLPYLTRCYIKPRCLFYALAYAHLFRFFKTAVLSFNGTKRSRRFPAVDRQKLATQRDASLGSACRRNPEVLADIRSC